MFISFFSGKVMLFFGISLIMKEKSNALALGRETFEPGTWDANQYRERIVSNVFLHTA